MKEQHNACIFSSAKREEEEEEPDTRCDFSSPQMAPVSLGSTRTAVPSACSCPTAPTLALSSTFRSGTLSTFQKTLELSTSPSTLHSSGRAQPACRHALTYEVEGEIDSSTFLKFFPDASTPPPPPRKLDLLTRLPLRPSTACSSSFPSFPSFQLFPSSSHELRCDRLRSVCS